MHNNGTNRIILPQKSPILGPMRPRQGIDLELRPEGVIMRVSIDDRGLELMLDIPTVMQLGVNLISAGAVHAASVAGRSPIIGAPAPEPEAPAPEPIEAPAADPFAHESTDPSLGI